MTTQKDIDKYVIGTITAYPLFGREQLESMVILHYDIPDTIAHDMVGKALVRAIELYSREEKLAENKLRNIRETIDRLRKWTPECNPIDGVYRP